MEKCFSVGRKGLEGDICQMNEITEAPKQILNKTFKTACVLLDPLLVLVYYMKISNDSCIILTGFD